MIENNCYPASYIGIDLWRDDVPSRQPEHRSVLIKGTTGTNRQVKELRPDKLALRKIVGNKELFILINLRSAGWHRYNGAGSIILAQHGGAVMLKDHYGIEVVGGNNMGMDTGSQGNRDIVDTAAQDIQGFYLLYQVFYFL